MTRLRPPPLIQHPAQAGFFYAQNLGAEPIVHNLTALSPWMANLPPESRDAVRRNVAQAPPLSDRQRERLRLLFRKITLGESEKGNKNESS